MTRTLRSIDNATCRARHIVRCQSGDEGAVEVQPGVYFRANDERGINGEQGWQNAQVVRVLEDSGSLKIALPNSTGDDGVRHLRRFSILTDPAYQPGEEWIEMYSDVDEAVPLQVASPETYGKSPSVVELAGPDLMCGLAGSLSSEVDQWDAVAPGDALGHYSGAAVEVYGASGLGMLREHLTGPAHLEELFDVSVLSPRTINSEAWSVELALRWLSEPEATSSIALFAGSILGLTVATGKVQMLSALAGQTFGTSVPGVVTLKLVRRYGHVWGYVNGVLVAESRDRARFSAGGVPSSISIILKQGHVEIDRVSVETVAPYARAETDLWLPGKPPAEGLHAEYWGVPLERGDKAAARAWPTIGEGEAAIDRVEPTVDHTPSTPVPVPGPAWLARWSGAIFLDLASHDREIRLTGQKGTYCRIYVGRLLPGYELASSWAQPVIEEPTIPPNLATGSLRAALGEVSGWYPIKVEQLVATPGSELAGAEKGMVLEDRPLPGGAFVVVPQARLSPLGCYTDLVRYTPHRQLCEQIAASFGYQWRVEPRKLESGFFPGQITNRVEQGRVTEMVVDDESLSEQGATEVQVQGTAADVVDGIVADAAGLADPRGNGQLNAQVVDYGRAGQHMLLRQVYESLSEITEPALLRSRLSAQLTLRSSPNEQVGVRVDGHSDLLDSIELTGDLARFDWLAGDSLRLNLASVDVVDLEPRQIKAVTWEAKPDALGSPTLGFRQRARTPRTVLRRLTDAIYGPRRTFQGAITKMPATVGGATHTGAGFAAVDGLTRAVLPGNLGQVVKGVLVVHFVEGAGWKMELSPGVEGEPVTAPGRYDVTRLLAPDSAGAPYAWARLVGGTSGAYIMTLEVTVAVGSRG